MGAGSGAYADAFINLGDKLHKNFSGNMEAAWQNRQARNRLEEDKRQFDLSELLKKRGMLQEENQFNRTSNMSAINMLANKRMQAMNQFQNQYLKDAAFNLR